MLFFFLLKKGYFILYKIIKYNIKYWIGDEELEGKINKSRENLAEKLDFPKEVIMDIPKITIVGRDEITIENHKGILLFERDLIKVNSKIGPISILGGAFEILYISSCTMTISGLFKEIKYEGFEE